LQLIAHDDEAVCTVLIVLAVLLTCSTDYSIQQVNWMWRLVAQLLQTALSTVLSYTGVSSVDAGQ
jgi:hypothetical protein